MATDLFNRANGAIGSDWSGDAWTIVGNTAEADHALGQSRVYWVGAGTNPGADQYSEVVLATTIESQLNKGPGPAVRVATGATRTYYAVACNSNASGGFQLIRVVGGAQTNITRHAATPVSGDTVKLSAVGTTIKVFLNSAEVISVTDANIASGEMGMSGLPWNAWGNINSWSGGPEGGGGGGGRLHRSSPLDGLGGAGQQRFNPSLSYHRSPISLEAYRRERAREMRSFMAKVRRAA